MLVLFTRGHFNDHSKSFWHHLHNILPSNCDIQRPVDSVHICHQTVDEKHFEFLNRLLKHCGLHHWRNRDASSRHRVLLAFIWRVLPFRTHRNSPSEFRKLLLILLHHVTCSESLHAYGPKSPQISIKAGEVFREAKDLHHHFGIIFIVCSRVHRFIFHNAVRINLHSLPHFHRCMPRSDDHDILLCAVHTRLSANTTPRGGEPDLCQQGRA